MRGSFFYVSGSLLEAKGSLLEAKGSLLEAKWSLFEVWGVTFWAQRRILRPFGIGSAHKSPILRISHLKMTTFGGFWGHFEVIWKAKDDQKEVQIRYQQSIEFWFGNLMIFYDIWSVCQVKNNQKPLFFFANHVFLKSWTLRPNKLDVWFPKWSKIDSRGW